MEDFTNKKTYKNFRSLTPHSGETPIRNGSAASSSRKYATCAVCRCVDWLCLAVHPTLVDFSVICGALKMGTVLPRLHMLAAFHYPHSSKEQLTTTYRKCSAHDAILTVMLCHRDDEKHSFST